MAKKKRRPNGRRPQREKSPSAIKQLTNIAKAALVVGSGVALFNNSQFGRTIKRELLPTLNKTVKKFNNELAGSRKKGIDIYDAYQKAVGKKGEAVKETLKQVRKTNANPKYKPRVTRERSLFGMSHNLDQVTKGKKGFGQIDKNAIDILEQKAIDELTAKFGDKYDPNVIKKIVKSTVRKRNQIEADKEFGTSFLKETLKKNKVSTEDAKSIMKDTLDYLGGASEITQSINRKKAEPLMEAIRKERLKLKKQDTRENLLLNKIGKKLGIDNLEEKFLGSKAMTLGELLDNEDILDIEDIEDLSKTMKDILENKDIKVNSLNDLKRLVNEDESWKNVIVDRNLRIRTRGDGSSEIFDNSEFAKVIEDFKDKINTTLPGKILTKGIDLKNIKYSPDIVFFHKGDKSLLSQFDKDAKNNELSEMKVGLRSGLFKHTVYNVTRNADDELQLGEALGEGYVIKMDRGTLPRIIKNFLGSDAVNNLSSDNKILQALDINQEGRGNLFNRYKRFFTKFTDEDWERNILDRAQDTIISGRTTIEELEHLQRTLGLTQKEAQVRLYEDSQVINELFSKLISKNAVEKDTIVQLLDVVTNENFIGASDASVDKVSDILNLILNDNAEDILEYLSSKVDYDITTKGLSRLISEYKDNTAEVIKRTTIHSTASKKIPILDMEFAETNVEFLEGELRLALLKELTSEGLTLSNALQELDLNGQQIRSLNLISQWQKYEKATGGIHEFNKKTLSLYGEAGAYDRYLTSLSDNEEYATDMVGILQEMKSEFGILHKGVDGNPNESYYSEYGAYEFLPTTKMSLGKSLIENANALIKELNGGRSNLDNVSPITMVSQYMVSRLSYGVDEAGFGLSHKSLTSPLDSIKNIALKRVLPAMAAYTAFDYLNDLSQDVTGTGITGATANSVRNLDLLGRNIAYHTGVGQALDWLKQTSVIGEYWTGSTDFQNVEERKDWYENGYSPVRKSRFWSFGSASEYRGGDITFFQPNYWRRAHSDYYDKWLYGSNSEKWAHSIIPTPTHPLSTIRYLMDPYWLEKKHIDDAPTPLTGKMFSEGTPWGAVLNPTVGQVIKPVRMLPEVRKRLTGKGHDSKAIIKRINDRTKLKKDRRKSGASNQDIIVINGTDIRNATYIPYGNPSANELIITNGRAKGIGYVEKLSDVSAYQVPTYTPSESGGQEYGGGYYGGGSQQSGSIPVSKTARKVSKGLDTLNAEISKQNNGLSQGIIESINNAIKSGRKSSGPAPVYSSSPDSTSEGTYIYNNLVNEYNTYTSNYYDDKFMPGFLDDGFGSQTRDYMRDIGYSAKQLSGIYGFLKDVVTGGPQTTYRWENAGSYQSFSTRFWDAGVGGTGGGLMEIARRFFPSSDKSRVDYNPLRNNVADWLPDYLQVGNPFSKLTKGAMRLPGKGYESLNELHPDEYATDGYGAFDRFKILADVAPNSKEYKIWHNIVKHQTLMTNPELKEEVEDIESRTKRMRGSHEFYEYQYLHTNTNYQTGVVKKVTQQGQVILGNNQVLTLAGIKLNQNYNGELNDLLTPGKKITYRIDNDVSYDDSNKPIRNAAIYINKENVNKQLMDMGVADRDKADTSAIGQLATVSAGQEILGAAQELIAHARIPFVHNKLMHIETALESFKSEQMYGANFQTWDHPIEGFVKPMLNEAIGQSLLMRSAAVAYKKFHFDSVLTSNASGFKKFMSGAVLATLDPAAMLGGGLNFAIGLNDGGVSKGDKPLGKFSTGAKIGSTIGTLAWGWHNADNPIKAGLSFAAAGIDLFNEYELGDMAKQLMERKAGGELTEEALQKLAKYANWKGAAAIGAVIGLTVSAIKNPDFDWDRMTEKWKPKKFEKINEINEYYDRLEYIKYSGLYEAAARKAALLEGSNIKSILKDIDKNKKRIGKLKEKQRKLLSKHNENSAKYKSENAKIQEEIDALTQRGNQMFTGGKYTKAAIAYKRAMESTIYGLQSTATQDEILAAVPDQYKDYFQAFMEETDEGERKKILKHLPDYLKRPLQAAWGEKMEDTQSNTRYFRSHKLPNITWRGWKPNVNLKHVKMKTIENEGMLLSEFGYYESEKAKPQYMMAPEIDNYDRGGGLGMATYTRLAAELKGAGVSLSNISLEQTSAPGLWITSDIKQSISDRYELASNSMTNMIQGIVANFI